MNRLLLILLSIFATPAAAAGPVIWGPNGSAPMLNAGPLVTNDGRSIQTPGAINFAKNTNATTNLSGITDLGTGTTSSRTTTTSEISAYPWYQTAIKLTNAGSGTGSTRIVCFQLPAAYKSTKLGVSWLQIPGAGYVAGDYTVDVYSDNSSDCNGTETRLSLSTDSSSITALPASTQPFKTTFDSTTADYYEVRITRAAGSSGATSWLSFNEFYVGPGITAQGAVVGEWVSFTPTLTASGGGSVSVGTGTTALASGKYRRVGSDMESMVTWRWGNASTAFGTSGFYALALPGGLTLNQSALPYTSTSTDSILGQGYYYDSDVADFYPLAVSPSLTTGLIYFPITTSLSAASLGTTAPVTIANGDEIVVRFTAPIAEWAGSGTVNLGQNDVEYASNSSTASTDDTTSFAYGPSGSLIPTITAAVSGASTAKQVHYSSPVQAGDQLVLEVLNNGGTGDWIPIANATNYTGFIKMNGTVYGAGFYNSGLAATDVTVFFGKGGAMPTGATLGSAGTNWPIAAGDKWRLKKFSGAAATGFGNVAQSSSGLVKSAGQLLGTNTNDVAATGYVGEYVENNRSTDSPNQVSTTIASVDASSVTLNDGAETGITLTAGDWDISGAVFFRTSGVVAVTAAAIWIGTAKGTSLTGQTLSKNYAELSTALTAGADFTLMTPIWRVSISSTTTYYLKAQSTFSGGTSLNYQGNLRARRAR